MGQINRLRTADHSTRGHAGDTAKFMVAVGTQLWPRCSAWDYSRVVEGLTLDNPSILSLLAFDAMDKRLSVPDSDLMHAHALEKSQGVVDPSAGCALCAEVRFGIMQDSMLVTFPDAPILTSCVDATAPYSDRPDVGQSGPLYFRIGSQTCDVQCDRGAARFVLTRRFLLMVGLQLQIISPVRAARGISATHSVPRARPRSAMPRVFSRRPGSPGHSASETWAAYPEEPGYIGLLFQNACRLATMSVVIQRLTHSSEVHPRRTRAGRLLLPPITSCPSLESELN